MIPLRDDEPSHSKPVVTIVLIAINLAFFLYELSLGTLLFLGGTATLSPLAQ